MLWGAKLVSQKIGKSIPLHVRVASIAVHRVDTTRVMVLNTVSHVKSRDDILQGWITGHGDRFLVPGARRRGRSTLAGFAGQLRSRPRRLNPSAGLKTPSCVRTRPNPGRPIRSQRVRLVTLRDSMRYFSGFPLKKPRRWTLQQRVLLEMASDASMTTPLSVYLMLLP
jgi:hypothetical protein